MDRDHLLTNVMIYWLTATAGSSANFYYEIADVLPTAATPPPLPPPLPVRLGVAAYPKDSALPIRRFADQEFPNIVHWREFGRGGHFAAMEPPNYSWATCGNSPHSGDNKERAAYAVVQPCLVIAAFLCLDGAARPGWRRIQYAKGNPQEGVIADSSLSGASGPRS